MIFSPPDIYIYIYRERESAGRLSSFWGHRLCFGWWSHDIQVPERAVAMSWSMQGAEVVWVKLPGLCCAPIQALLILSWVQGSKSKLHCVTRDTVTTNPREMPLVLFCFTPCWEVQELLWKKQLLQVPGKFSASLASVCKAGYAGNSLKQLLLSLTCC